MTQFAPIQQRLTPSTARVSSRALVSRLSATAEVHARRRLGLRQLVRMYKRQQGASARRPRNQSYISAAIQKHHHIRAVRGYAYLDPRLSPLSTGTRLDTMNSRRGWAQSHQLLGSRAAISSRQRARGLRQLRYLQARRSQKLGPVVSTNKYGARVITFARVNVYSRPLLRVRRYTERRAVRRTTRRTFARMFSSAGEPPVVSETNSAASRVSSTRNVFRSAFMALTARRFNRIQRKA